MKVVRMGFDSKGRREQLRRIEKWLKRWENDMKSKKLEEKGKKEEKGRKRRKKSLYFIFKGEKVEY